MGMSSSPQPALEDGHNQEPGRSESTASGVKPLVKEWYEETTEGYSELLSFWKLRKAILKTPSLSLRKLKIKPLKFAVYVTVLPSLLFGVCEHAIGVFKDLPPSSLERTAQALKIAHDRSAEAQLSHKDVNGDDIKDLPDDVKAQMRFFNADWETTQLEQRLSLVNAMIRVEPISDFLTHASIPLSALLNAVLFVVFMRKYHAEYPATEQAGRVYLYYVASLLAVPAFLAGFCLSALELWGRYADLSDSTVTTVSNWLLGAWVVWGMAAMVRASVGDLRSIFEMNAKGSAAANKWAVWWPLLWASMITGGCIGLVFSGVRLAALLFYWR